LKHSKEIQVKKRVLLLEDEAIMGMYLTRMLEANGYDVVVRIATGEHLLEAFKKHLPDIIIADIHLAGALTGDEAVEGLVKKHPAVQALFITGDQQYSGPLKQPLQILTKPFTDRQLLEALDRLSD
jgi:CheY-like chemotaxis protein